MRRKMRWKSALASICTCALLLTGGGIPTRAQELTGNVASETEAEGLQEGQENVQATASQSGVFLYTKWTWDADTGTLTIEPDPSTTQGNLMFHPSQLGFDGDYAWSKFPIKKLIVKEGCEMIAARAFYGKRLLAEIQFPQSLRRIELAAFDECSSLKKVTLPKNMEYVNQYAFPTYVQVECLNPELTKVGDNGFIREKEIQLDGVRDYTYIKKLSDVIVAKCGTGGTKTLDAELTEQAMKRAEEQTVFFSKRTRPDGTTITTGYNGSFTEVGVVSAKADYEKDPDGTIAKVAEYGYRELRDSSNSNAIGIGCFIHNGYVHWTMLYQKKTTPTPYSGQYAAKDVRANVMISEDPFARAEYVPDMYQNVSTTLESGGCPGYKFETKVKDTSLTVGDTTTTRVILTNTVKDTSSEKFTTRVVLNGKNVTWESSDPSVAAVDASGRVTAKKKGTAVITAKIGSMNSIVGEQSTVTVKAAGSTGGNTGGSTGGSTGGGSTGGNTGGSTGGSTGGNTGGSTGGSTGGNTGGNTGGSTGGNTGGSTGGNTGGSAGGNTGSTENPSKVDPVTITYRTHVQTYGWQDYVENGITSGTSGEAKRLEGINIAIKGKNTSALGVRYQTHVQSYGWQEWKADGAMSGTSAEAKRLEAIKIELTGSESSKYDVYYRVHAQTYGWLGWAKNGQPAGTSGQAKRLEAIQIVVLPKGQTPDDAVGYSYIELGKTAGNSDNAGMVNYMTHVQTYGDQSYVYDGSVSGTFGEAKRLEGIRINLNTSKLGVNGSISYQTHVQTYGWLDWSKDGAFNGTHGEAKRLEAIRIKLSGDAANKYDVYYRVHAQTYGWLGWAKNGESAGTEGFAKRLEGIQIVLLPKGSQPPSILPGVSGTAAFIKK